MKADGRDPPSLRRSIVLNAANLGLNILFPLVSFAYTARILGPEAMGRVGFAFAASGIFLVLASLSLPIYGAKAVAQARDKREALDATFSELFLLNLAASAFWSATFLLLAALVPAMRADWPLFLAAGSALLWNAFHVDWVFAGLENFRALLLRGVAMKALSLALLPILVRNRDDVLAFALLNVTAGGLSNLWGLAAALRRVNLRVSGLRVRRHVRSLAAVSGSSVATGLYLQVDNVLLGLLAGPHAVGLYAAAMKVPRLASAFLASLGTTALPRLAWHATDGEGSREAAIAVREKSLYLLLFLAIPVTTIGIALGPRLVEAYAGPEFAEAASAMRLGLLLILPAASANLVAMQVLLPHGGEKALLAGSLAGAVCGIAANLLFIPAWGFAGSAAAAVGTELAVLSVYLLYAWSRGLMTRGQVARGAIRRRLSAGIAAAGAAWGVALLFEAAWAACAAGLACGGLVYFGTLAAARDEVAGEILRTVLRGSGGGSAPRGPT